MKRINFLMAILGVLTLFSCSKEELPGNPGQYAGETKKVSISAAKTRSRASGPDVADKALTAVNDAVILFFDASGKTVFNHTLTSAEVALFNKTVGGTYSDVVTINNVPQTATQLFVVANYVLGTGGAYTDLTGLSTLNAVTSKTIAIATQQPDVTNSNGGVQNLLLASTQAETIDDPASEGDNYTAQTTIQPIVSRIQITGVAAKNGATAANEYDIVSFRLRGIFIPNTYQQGTILGGIGSNSIDKMTDTLNYTQNFPTANGPGFLNDYSTTALTKTGAVWAYHTFPATTAATLPDIIIAVDQVRYLNSSLTEASWANGEVQYITIENYYTAPNKGGDQITTFNAANVYSLGTIPYALSDLGDNPYEKAKPVSVTVTVLEWTVNNIYPGI